MRCDFSISIAQHATRFLISATSMSTDAEDTLRIHYIDVGQGECILVQTRGQSGYPDYSSVIQKLRGR